MSEAAPRNPFVPKAIMAIGDRLGEPGSHFDIGWIVSMDDAFVTVLQLPILGGRERRYMREEITMTELSQAGVQQKTAAVAPFEHERGEGISVRTVAAHEAFAEEVFVAEKA